MKRFIRILCLLAVTAVGQELARDKHTVLPGRHMSESQVVDIALKELPHTSEVQCEFKNGVWQVLEPQKGVWGVSSMRTNAEGKVFVTSTNTTRLVLRVRDADGKVEHVKTQRP